MLKTLTDIIASLGLIDGKVSVMTADQLDEFARNIPDKKISCNVFGVGGYSRNDADVLTKTVRICLLKQMPVNYNLATVDLAEAEMSTKLLAIMDALGDSPFINAENQTQITPELLTYDRTTLLVYLDVDLLGNASDCGGSPCIPEFFNNYVTEKFAEINESVDAAEAAEVAAELAQSLAEGARDAASGYADSARDSADKAKASEDNALISEGNASDSARASKDASEKSQQWAENPENVEVEPGKYSALHHAAKAEELSQLSERWAEEEEDVPVDDGKYSAKHWAAKSEEFLLSKENTANKQNSLAADGTGTKYPTVDAVNDALTLKADSIDLVEAKQSISTLESVLSDANINQEARVTASGVDTISLPKTAANTGMQVQLFGQSAENLVVNGDFRNGTTGWSSADSILSLSNKNLSVTGSGITTSPSFYKTITAKSGDKYYIKARLRVTNTLSPAINLYLQGSISTTTLLIATQTSAVQNTWYNLSAAGTSAYTGDLRYRINSVYSSISDSNGSVMEVDGNFGCFAINLTATFGAGNEPTKEQCDVLFANYFEGSDNVLGTGMVRSVGKNLFDKNRVNIGGISNTTGVTAPSLTNYRYTDYIPVIAGSQYRQNADTAGSGVIGAAFYDHNKSFISGVGVTNSAGRTITVPTGAKYIRTCWYVVQKSTDEFQFEKGAAETAYEPYRQSILQLTTPELRSNGLIKDEIRKGTNGYELVQRINPADGTVRAAPVITPIPHAGLLNSNSNGTAYFEPIIADAGVYSSNLAIQLTDYSIASFESIRKYADGTYTELNPATAVIASGGLSFTHPNLTAGDLVMFTYAYSKESIGRSMTLTHYDNRFVIADTANSKVYRWRITSTNGVATIQLTEV